jgi:hypothetical protein
MGALILGCGSAVTSGDWQKLVSSTGSESHEIPATPSKHDLDPLLKADPIERLVVHGTDADLGAVVVRLLRSVRVMTVPIAYVPVDRKQSAVARAWGLPAQAVEIALTAGVRPVPLVRDDAGGVLLGLGVMPNVSGTVYCDDEIALRGVAARIEVRPEPTKGLLVQVVRKGLLRERSQVLLGRAIQFGIAPSVPVRDGLEYPRPMERWTWYRHTEDLQAIR